MLICIANRNRGTGGRCNSVFKGLDTLRAAWAREVASYIIHLHIHHIHLLYIPSSTAYLIRIRMR